MATNFRYLTVMLLALPLVGRSQDPDFFDPELGMMASEYETLTNIAERVEIEPPVIEVDVPRVAYSTKVDFVVPTILPAAMVQKVIVATKQILSAVPANANMIEVQTILAQVLIGKTEVEVQAILSASLANATTAQIQPIMSAILADKTELDVPSVVSASLVTMASHQVAAAVKALLASATEIQIQSIVAALAAQGTRIQVTPIMSVMLAEMTEVQVAHVLAASVAQSADVVINAIMEAMLATYTEVQIDKVLAVTPIGDDNMLSYLRRKKLTDVIQQMKVAKLAGNVAEYNRLLDLLLTAMKEAQN